jgi:hypothetical protein
VLNFAYLEETYQVFEQVAPRFDFFPQSFRETLVRVRGYYLERPKSRSYQEPGEICYVYEPPDDQKRKGNDYKTIICTTKREEGFVTKDSGWVIIVDGTGKKVYSTGPFIRTSPDFFETLLEHGRIARWRTFYRPDRCEKFMLLVHGKALKSCFWRCAEHPWVREHNRRFDNLRRPFPPGVMEAITQRREDRRERREARGEEGKDPFAAFRLRMLHPWVKKSFSSEIEF